VHIYKDSFTMRKTVDIHFVRICIITIVIMMLISIITIYPYRPKVYRYTGFGIDVHPAYQIHGIDVSHYQSAINWQDVKQMEFQHVKIGFAFIKATEGTDQVDEYYLHNWYGAKRNNIITGAYHYFYADKSAAIQARNFIDIVSLSKNDLPPVLDVEDIGNASAGQLQQAIHEWLDSVQNYYHVKPIIYTYVDFYENYLAGKFDNYPLWIANYLSTDRPDINNDWLFWQHSQSGHVNGIDGYVDFSVFNGDSSTFSNLLLK
jgi:lysozyme